jgi:hypothetical protein
MDSIAFVQVDTDDSWINQLTSIYQEYNIYRSVIITDDKDTLKVIETYLEDDNNSYYSLSSHLYKEEFENFLKSNKRILLMDYGEFLESYEEFMQVLPNQHNLFVLENLDSFQEKHIIELFKSAIQRGFLKSDLPYYIWIN